MTSVERHTLKSLRRTKQNKVQHKEKHLAQAGCFLFRDIILLW